MPLSDLTVAKVLLAFTLRNGKLISKPYLCLTGSSKEGAALKLRRKNKFNLHLKALKKISQFHHKGKAMNAIATR